jgi:prophage regulatory protein
MHRDNGHPAPQPSPPTRRVIGQKELLQKLPISRTTLWRLIRAKKFPPPLQLSANRIGWFEDEVDRWLESQPRGFVSGMVDQGKA